MNHASEHRPVYQDAYAWEEKRISDLTPGDILVGRWENGKPHGVVNGPNAMGRDIVPNHPESADFVFVPVRPIEAAWDSSGLVYMENGQEGVYQVFAPHNETTSVAGVRKDNK